MFVLTTSIQNLDFKAVPAKKEPRPDGDTDHVGEITQLKEKIAFLEKTIKQKENQLISKVRISREQLFIASYNIRLSVDIKIENYKIKPVFFIPEEPKAWVN